jgi:outer membrane protein assembly factor BamB
MDESHFARPMIRIRVSLTVLLVLNILLFTSSHAQSLGTKKWDYATGGPILSSVAIDVDGTVYFGSNDKYLYALNSTGTLKWKFLTLGAVISAPCIGPDGTAYVASTDNSFYAVRTNGAKNWQLDSQSGFALPAIGADGTIYVSADGSGRALNPDGTAKWSFATGYSWTPSVGSDGTIYVGHTNGHLYAIRKDGTEKWKYRLGNGGIVWSVIWIDLDGTLYFFGRRDPAFSTWYSLYAIRTDGTEKYRTAEQPSANYTSGVLGQAGVMYLGFESVLQARHATNYQQKWEFTGPFNSSVTATPAVANDGTVYFCRSDGFLFAVNFDGSERWRFSIASPSSTAPAIDAQGTVYIGADDGKLYAVYGSSPAATTVWPMMRRDLRHTAAVSYPTYDQIALGINLYAGITLTGNIGTTYRIETTTSLSEASVWQPLTTITLDRTPYLFIDIESTNHPRRFYRAIQLP